MSNSSILSTDRTLSGTTTPDQSGPGSDGNEGELKISQCSSITGGSASDCLVSYPWHLLGGYLTSLQRCSWCILQPQPTWPYHSGSKWTWEQWQWRCTQHSPKLQLDWSLTIRLFIVISRTLTGEVVLPLCRDAVGIFYCSSQLGCTHFDKMQYQISIIQPGVTAE